MTKRIRQEGFSLIELLVAVAIFAALLAAVATAMHASLLSYKENEKIASVTSTARWILHGMMQEVRTATDVDSTATQLTIDPDGTGQNNIQYELSNNVLYCRRSAAGSTTTHVLLDSSDNVSVTAFSVVREVDTDTLATLSVTVRLALAMDNQGFAVTASAVPRRNQAY